MRNRFSGRLTLPFYTVMLAVFFILFTGSVPPEEGMYPLSELSKLDLKKAGLEIDVKEIYNPDGVSLVDALVNIGGCTGSFVSEKGLVLTNHHCAFGYIRAASTLENNYIEDGYLADSYETEIPAEGLTCLITESYRDVSAEILAAGEGKNLLERAEAMQEKMRELVAEEEKKGPNITAEVSEMFIGKTYVLFTYRTIRDVRIVYAPPRAVGEFGGDRDNWEWPRHNADFTFLRAYVAPDGTSAEYNENNVPFEPKKYLEVSPEGVDENDFIFIFGYPGRTYRHRTSFFMEFHRDYRLPFIADMFEDLIDVYNDLSADDPEKELALLSRVKSLANVQKNYIGKMLGLRKIDLVEKKRQEEKELAAFINSDQELQEKYGTMFDEIEKAHSTLFKNGRISLMFWPLSRYSLYYRAARTIDSYIAAVKEGMSEEDLNEKKEEVLLDFRQRYAGYYPDVEAATIGTVIKHGAQLPEAKFISVLEPLVKSDDPETAALELTGSLLDNSLLTTYEGFSSVFEMPAEELVTFEDPLYSFLMSFYNDFLAVNEENDVANQKLSIELAKLVDVKQQWKGESFIPDANSTLRFTYGYIKGYSPIDATYYSPVTTLDGVIEKYYLDSDYYTVPPKLKELYEKKKYGKYASEKLGSVPACILYNADTTGGNSGSPILDSKGRLVGLNFDRAFSATINDYAWNDEYSRSIGVDVRYILWFADMYSNADNLLEELGVR